MTGKHYKWHKRWIVDVEAASATHESGLVARFLLLTLAESQMQAHEGDAVIGQCWTPDGREWGVVTTPELLQQVFDGLAQKNGRNNAHQMIARLAREAGEVWVWHKSKDN
jgi:hypothetical protein